VDSNRLLPQYERRKYSSIRPSGKCTSLVGFAYAFRPRHYMIRNTSNNEKQFQGRWTNVCAAQPRDRDVLPAARSGSTTSTIFSGDSPRNPPQERNKRAPKDASWNETPGFNSLGFFNDIDKHDLVSSLFLSRRRRYMRAFGCDWLWIFHHNFVSKSAGKVVYGKVNLVGVLHQPSLYIRATFRWHTRIRFLCLP